MLILDIFLYFWLSLVCCMCTTLCYEEHRERYPNSEFTITNIKKRFKKSHEPLISENELTESVTDIEAQPVDPDEPPHWVQN